MSRFKLIWEDEAIPIGGALKIRHEFESEDLNIIMHNMTKFLQSSGYLNNSKHLTVERNVDLDEFTEKLFAGTTVPKE